MLTRPSITDWPSLSAIRPAPPARTSANRAAAAVIMLRVRTPGSRDTPGNRTEAWKPLVAAVVALDIMRAARAPPARARSLLRPNALSERASERARAARAAQRQGPPRRERASGRRQCGGGFAAPPTAALQSLHRDFRRLCLQMADPPHGLHSDFRRPCSQMEAPPHGLHCDLMRPCSQMEAPPQSLHRAF